MSFDARRILELLPAVYRLRDAEGAGGTKDALRALIAVIAEQVAVLEEDVAQLYDDAFIETCADWVVPYIGDLIGHRGIYGVAPAIGSPRAEVANTIALRRRKGTASMLEQLARDVTGWDARVVEYFQRLATTQYLNHVRLSNQAWTSVRRASDLFAIGTPFDTTARTLDVRRIAKGRGRFNVPNVGLHLWRIRDFRLERSPAVKLVEADPADRRYHFSPLGADAPLFSHAVAEDSISHLAERANVPMPIGRRELWNDVDAFYPSSVSVNVGGVDLPAAAVAASDLSDFAGAWAYAPGDRALIDPALGRLSLPATLQVDGSTIDATDPIVTFHYGFSAEMGGGPYPRSAGFDATLAPIVAVAAPASLGAAIASLSGSGVVEAQENGRFVETLTIAPPSGARVALRSIDGSRATLKLGGELTIALEGGAEVTLDGWLILGAGIRVTASGDGGRLVVRNCTLVPGLSLLPDGTPEHPGSPSIVVESASVSLAIERSIVGGLRAHEDATVRIASSIVDSSEATGVAYAAADGEGPGGAVEIVASTVVGKVHARVLALVSNSILMARLAEPDPWTEPVRAERRQEGCIRFSYVPLGSRTPRRYRCQPQTEGDVARVQPQFTSERYGSPAYAQLAARCALEVRTGADDESEMGAFHDLFGPQRDSNLAVRLDETLRFGLEAGIFHAS